MSSAAVARDVEKLEAVMNEQSTGSPLEVPSTVSAALDQVHTNVFMADMDLNLIYMNEKSKNTLRAIGGVLRQTFGVELHEVLGGSIHRFHKNPARIERILRTPGALPHNASFGFGGVTLQTSINAVTGADGQRKGYIVNWEDITEAEKVKKDLHAVLGAVGQATETIDALTEMTRMLGETAEETQQQANGVSASAGQVSDNIQSVAAATEEMVASVREISRNASHAAEIATSAVEMARSTNTTVQKLGVSSQEIGNVIKVITSIAQQTNLLALNATIEAARAGEAGKGFAVVANEVNELAKKTARATEEIGQKIEAIQSDTGSAVEAITEIGQIIDRINDIQTSIAGAVEEQSATTDEIGRTVQEAAQASTEIAGSVVQVAEAAGSTTVAVADGQEKVAELAQFAEDLRRVAAQVEKG